MTDEHHGNTGLYVLLLTRDEIGVSGFPGILVPGDQVMVPDLPADRLYGIEAGEIVVIPPPESEQEVLRVRATRTDALRVDGAETVTAVIHLAGSVAQVPRGQISTPEAFQELVLNRHPGDLISGLRAVGVTPTLRVPGDGTGDDGNDDILPPIVPPPVDFVTEMEDIDEGTFSVRACQITQSCPR